jgi:adenylate cyclase, class 2
MNQPDDTEFEAKFYPIEKDEYRDKLKSLGGKLVASERKMKRALVDRRDFPQLKCNYIRVRDEGGVIRISAKIHAEEGGNLTDQKEVDIEVSNYDKAIKIIEMMGFTFGVYQETLRETWELEGAEVTIDTWPGLLTYSEIEASSEEHVQELAGKLGFDWNKKIITSPLEIFMRVYNLSLEEVLKMTAHLTFEKNPFADLAPDNTWAR